MRRSEPCRLVYGGMHSFSVGFGLRPQRYGYRKFVLRTTFASWQIYYTFFALNTTAIKKLSYGQSLPHGKSITHSSPSTLRLSKICPTDKLCLMGSYSIHALSFLFTFLFFLDEKKRALQARVWGDASFFRRFRASPSTLRLSKICPADRLCLMRISFPLHALNATAIKNLSCGQALADGFIFNTRPLISIYVFIFFG